MDRWLLSHDAAGDTPDPRSKQEERWLIDRIQIENMWVTGNSSVLFGRRLALP
jgi:hypothetical protein